MKLSTIEIKAIRQRLYDAFGQAVMDNDAERQDLVRNRYDRAMSAFRKRGFAIK